jgi:hypothetical protein
MMGDNSGVILFALVVVFISSIIVFQPLIKRYVSEVCVTIMKRKIVGEGVGIIKSILLALSGIVYMWVTGGIFFVFILEVFFDYEIKTPPYVFSPSGFINEDKFWLVIINLIIAGVFIFVLSVLSLLWAAFVIVYLGISSLHFRRLSKEEKIQAKKEHDPINNTPTNNQDIIVEKDNVKI